MPLLTPGDTVPTSVSKFLLPNEDRVITTRKHPAVLARPVVFVLVGLVIAGLLTEFVAKHSGLAVLIIWLVWLLLLGYLVFQTLDWLHNYFVITPRRMLLTSGFITRKVAMMPMTKVTDMSFQRDFQGRLLGYGTFILESAGQDQALRVVDHLPYPEQLYLEVCGLLFPVTDPADD
jgi:membrane protein YdbS with pleckstrin-like domain